MRAQQDNRKKENKQDKQKNEENNNEDKKEGKAQPKEERMSKDNAEQLLNAAIQNEKSTQQRLRKAMQKQSPRRGSGKNW